VATIERLRSGTAEVDVVADDAEADPDEALELPVVPPVVDDETVGAVGGAVLTVGPGAKRGLLALHPPSVPTSTDATKNAMTKRCSTNADPTPGTAWPRCRLRARAI